MYKRKINTQPLTFALILLIVFSMIQVFAYPLSPPPSPYPTTYQSTNIDIEFRVYPDRTIELAGNYSFNYTSPYMLITGPDTHSEVRITKEGELFTLTTNNLIMFHEEQKSQFPLNSTTLSIAQEYTGEIATTSINGSIVFPDSWAGYPYSTYINFNLFPYNSTDFTITGQYSDETYNAVLTVQLIPGLALSSIDMNIEGNITHLLISDSIKVFYNYTLPVPGFTSINETVLRGTILNQTFFEEMLYDATGGLLTCQLYNVTLSPIDQNAAIIYVNIVLQGNLIEILAKIYENIVLQFFYGGSYYIPPEMISVIAHDLANITIRSVEEINFELWYISSARTFGFAFDMSINLEKMRSMIAQLMVDDFPQEIQPDIEEFLEVKYALTKSYTETITYKDGRIEYSGNYVFEGNLNTEIDRVKDLCMELMIKSTPYPPPSRQIAVLNETKIIDMSNFRFKFDQEYYQNTQLVSLSFEGVKITPPIDPINSTCFRLERFFNITYSPYEIPRSNDRLKLTVKGETNGTHTVIPVIDPTDPESVPNPDAVLSGNTFVWNNQSISKLRRLIFRIYKGFALYIEKESVSPNNPYIINAINVANCEVIVSEIQSNAIITVNNVTLPEDVSPPPGTYKVLGNYIRISSETGDISGNFTIKIYYNPDQLAELGIDVNSLKIFYWNSTKNEWVPVETRINSEENYVWAIVDHLSIWAVMGQISQPFWTETWFLVVILSIVIIVGILATLLVRKRRKTSTET